MHLIKLVVVLSLLLFTGMGVSPAGAQSSAASSTVDAAPNAIFPAIIARVNGSDLLGRDLEQLVRSELSSIGNPDWKSLREDYRNQLTLDLMNVMISSRLLYLKAAESGYKVTNEEVQAEFQKIAKTFKDDAEMNAALAAQHTDRAALEKSLSETLLMSKFVEENIRKKVTIAPEEVAKYYSSNPKEFHHPDLVRTSHILIQPAGDNPEQDAKARERAESLLARIKKGEDFARLAKENSVDASAAQGGDIGLMSRQGLDPDYAAAAFALPVGGLKVAKSQFGYHVIKVTEKKNEGVSALEEVKDGLTEYLKGQKAQAELTKFVGDLQKQAKIEILIPGIQ